MQIHKILEHKFNKRPKEVKALIHYWHSRLGLSEGQLEEFSRKVVFARDEIFWSEFKSMLPCGDRIVEEYLLAQAGLEKDGTKTYVPVIKRIGKYFQEILFP